MCDRYLVLWLLEMCQLNELLELANNFVEICSKCTLNRNQFSIASVFWVSNCSLIASF